MCFNQCCHAYINWQQKILILQDGPKSDQGMHQIYAIVIGMLTAQSCLDQQNWGDELPLLPQFLWKIEEEIHSLHSDSQSNMVWNFYTKRLSYCIYFLLLNEGSSNDHHSYIVDIHWEHPLKIKRKEDCQYVYDEVLCKVFYIWFRSKLQRSFMANIYWTVRTSSVMRNIINVPAIIVYHWKMSVTWSGTVQVV